MGAGVGAGAVARRGGERRGGLCWAGFRGVSFYPRTVGKFPVSSSLEAGPGIAHSGGCQEVGGGVGGGGRAGGTPARPKAPLTSCIPGAAGGGRRQLGHGAEPAGWARAAEVEASSCLTAIPLNLLLGTEECSFLSQSDPDDPAGRKSPGLAGVRQSRVGALRLPFPSCVSSNQ